MDPLRAEGITGQVELDDEFITIRRKGFRAFLNQGMKGDKRIPLASVTAVQFKKAGLTDGYLQLSILGGVESRAGWGDSGSDENTVTFSRRQQADFEAIRDRLEGGIVMRARGGAAPPGVDIPDQIRKLAALRDEGLLTADEFEAKKSDLLGKM